MSETKRRFQSDPDQKDEREFKRVNVGIAAGGAIDGASRPTIRYYCPSRFAQECHAAFPRHIPQLLLDYPSLSGIDFFDDKASCEAKTRCGDRSGSSGLPVELQSQVASLLSYKDLDRYLSAKSGTSTLGTLFPTIKEEYVDTDRLIRGPVSGPRVLRIDEFGLLDDLVDIIYQRPMDELISLVNLITDYRLQDRLSDRSKIKIISLLLDTLYIDADSGPREMLDQVRGSLFRIANSHWINTPELVETLFIDNSIYSLYDHDDDPDSGDLIEFWNRLIISEAAMIIPLYEVLLEIVEDSLCSEAYAIKHAEIGFEIIQLFPSTPETDAYAPRLAVIGSELRLLELLSPHYAESKEETEERWVEINQILRNGSFRCLANRFTNRVDDDRPSEEVARYDQLIVNYIDTFHAPHELRSYIAESLLTLSHLGHNRAMMSLLGKINSPETVKLRDELVSMCVNIPTNPLCLRLTEALAQPTL